MRPLLKPHNCLLAFGQRDGIFTAGKRAGLKRLKAVDHDKQKVFLLASVHTDFLDWSILEVNSEGVDYPWIHCILRNGRDKILMVSTTVSWLINSFNNNLLAALYLSAHMPCPILFFRTISSRCMEIFSRSVISFMMSRLNLSFSNSSLE